LNLPIKVVINNPTDAVNSGSIEFLYDATGTKLRKTVKYSNGSVKETWDYVNGVEYKNQILQRVAHSEGAVVRNDLGAYQHEYVLRDHLGNTRVTFTDGVNKGEPYWDWSNYSYIAPDNTGYDDGVVTEADIKHINHTYPFGMAMEGNWNNAGSANHKRYLYNGKQWNDDFGLGWNHHDWRFYDVAIGRFITIDPESEKDGQMSWNPYHFALDNPIRYNDPNGRNPIVGALGAVGRIVLRRVLVRSMVAPKPPSLAVRRGMQELTRQRTTIGKVDNTRLHIPNQANGLRPTSSSPTRVEARSDNKLHPDPDATGDHSTYDKDDNGNTYKHQEWNENSRNPNGFDPGKRFDGGKKDGSPGAPHYDRRTGTNTPTPHVNERNGHVRPPNNNEIPDNPRFR
jgi:RHS repeat-associated protein